MAPYISTAHKLFLKSKPTAHRPYSAAALIYDVGAHNIHLNLAEALTAQNSVQVHRIRLT